MPTRRELSGTSRTGKAKRRREERPHVAFSPQGIQSRQQLWNQRNVTPIVQHQVRAGLYLVRRPLPGHPASNFRFCLGTSRHGPFQTYRFRCRNSPDGIAIDVAARLVQDGRLSEDNLSPQLTLFVGPPIEMGADHRMDQRIQRGKRFGIRKHAAGQNRPIQTAVRKKNVCTEEPDHSWKQLGVAVIQQLGFGVRVVHGKPHGSKDPRHRRLARANPSCQSDTLDHLIAT